MKEDFGFKVTYNFTDTEMSGVTVAMMLTDDVV